LLAEGKALGYGFRGETTRDLKRSAESGQGEVVLTVGGLGRPLGKGNGASNFGKEEREVGSHFGSREKNSFFFHFIDLGKSQETYLVGKENQDRKIRIPELPRKADVANGLVEG